MNITVILIETLVLIVLFTIAVAALAVKIRLIRFMTCRSRL